MTPAAARKSKTAKSPTKRAAAKPARKTAGLIDVMVQSPRWNKQPRASAIVRKAIQAAAKATSTPLPELAIVLTDDSAIQALNRDWRGFDKPTNVLSFPAPKRRAERAHDGRSLGDVIIAFQTVAREAADEGKSFKHHLAHLTVHGFLHLLGYDHETDRDARTMERLEVKILAGLRVPDPYVEPSSVEQSAKC
jgi:probable rRNA maturation factor